MKFFNRWKKEPAPVEEVRTGFWSNPLFDNPDVRRVYEQYLLRAGHCPVCKDFLFIDIEYRDGYYDVQKRCISHECDYKVDVSDGFNQSLGLVKPKPPVKPLKESQPNVKKSFPLTTGTLKRSYPRFNPQLKTKVTKRLPSPSQATTDAIYIVPNGNGRYKIYVTTEFCDEYSWRLLDGTVCNIDEFTIEHKYDIERREDVYKCNPNGEVKVCK